MSEAQQKRGKRNVRWLFWIVGVSAVLATLVFGRNVIGKWYRHKAAQDMDVWALSDVLARLDQAAWIDPGNPETELMRARCYRHLRDGPRREQSLKLAKRFGASETALKNEISLGEIQAGRQNVSADNELGRLMESGVSPHEAAAAFISGCLVRNEHARAAALLSAWASDFPDHPHCLYMQGISRAMQLDVQGTGKAFEQALAMEPRHELAQIALSQHLEAVNQHTAALKLLSKLADRHPQNKTILLSLARNLRKLGRPRQAKSVLASVVAEADASPALVVELGHIEMESGNYPDAKDWFDKADASSMRNHETLTAAGIALALSGEPEPARQVLQWITDDQARNWSLDNLRTRLTFDPHDKAAAIEFQELRQISSFATPYVSAIVDARNQRDDSEGMRLYRVHCSACHGATGNGDGRAARTVFPRPRNLRTELMRLVSTRSGNPSRDDVRAVIRLGVPGTSMTPLETVSDREIDLLVDVTLQMRKDGLRDQFTAMLRESEEPMSEDEAAEFVEMRSQPGEVVIVPAFGAIDQKSIAEGKSVYTAQTCHSCHGDTGAGYATTPAVDSLGTPNFSRDLVNDLFKGGNSAESIYLRVLLGMPGTSHPANVGLTGMELTALVQYCQSLGREPKRNLTNYQRWIQASSRAVNDPNVAP